ncbi:hypothetical protein J5N97_021089 [Dioscorea zingiberensis]|uniref:Flavin-containing monooxygenase n=1 Tax=Dioscorea zingiberensis TaxID=325984 RepID=A0A9D5CHL5_9LILI|nr:hypothetical protein J5N97_021089 [Dioscorea zingiberensis]
MNVVSATFNDDDQKWLVVAEDTVTGELHEHKAKFLVVATGENGSKNVPLIPGLSTFTGEAIHSSEYKSPMKFTGKNVLVVGCGNSGMEIAYDLSNSGIKTSILVRSPFHVTTKEMIYAGMLLSKFLPINVIDKVVISLAKDYFGDLSKYDIDMPEKGPFAIKATTGRAAVIDVGTIDKIKAGLIKVYKTTIEKIGGDEVVFSDGRSECFDAIIFATGYTSKAHMWLKDNEELLNDEGFPKQSYPNHWKASNGVYCVGLARRGLPGVSSDAENIAKDIRNQIN